MVKLKELSKNAEEKISRTDDNGIYSFSALAPGAYEIWVDPALDADANRSWGTRRLQVTLSRGGCERIIWTAHNTKILGEERKTEEVPDIHDR